MRVYAHLLTNGKDGEPRFDYYHKDVKRQFILNEVPQIGDLIELTKRDYEYFESCLKFEWFFPMYAHFRNVADPETEVRVNETLQVVGRCFMYNEVGQEQHEYLPKYLHILLAMPGTTQDMCLAYPTDEIG
jgi:hypothetical protein